MRRVGEAAIIQPVSAEPKLTEQNTRLKAENKALKKQIKELQDELKLLKEAEKQ